MTEKLEKEGSVTGNVTGFSAPFGMSKRKTAKKKKNPSKPFGESAVFENAVAYALLYDKSLSEVVKKIGNKWAIVDDKTGATKGTYDKRSDAWEKQKIMRQQQKSAPKSKKPKSSKPKKSAGSRKAPGAQVAPKPKLAPRPKTEEVIREFKDRIKKKLQERSMIAYVFDQKPLSADSAIWDHFVSKLSREAVMSDPKLKNLIQGIAKAEAKILGKSLDEISKILSAAGSFSLSRGELSRNELGDIVLGFTVDMVESGSVLEFGIKIDNGKPLILFPDETKHILNSLSTSESKLLRAELIHAQETALNAMDDVQRVSTKRDTYLKSMQDKIVKIIDGLSPTQLSMLRYVLKSKKGIK